MTQQNTGTFAPVRSNIVLSEQEQQAWKEECLKRWREARKILCIRSLNARREMIEEAGRRDGEQYKLLLQMEIKRQWDRR